MAHTASIRLVSSAGFFTRLVAAFDRAMMAIANTAVRNGDLPHFGL